MLEDVSTESISNPYYSTIDGYESRFEKIAKKIGHDRKKVARLVLAISYVEYSGMRAISSTCRGTHVSSATMQHILDEGRHAHYLYKMASKLNEGELDYSMVPTTKATAHYYNRLYVSAKKILHGVCRDLSVDDLDYNVFCFVVSTVELRAIKMFKVLNKLSNQYDWGVNFNLLISDELDHLNMVNEPLKSILNIADPGYRKFIAYEGRFYNYYLKSLENYFNA
ncbi:MAG: hypothetical protein ACXVAX_00890 [Pseudobdellovibrio sp.]